MADNHASCVALGLAALSDRLYYGTWTLPPLTFLHFNIAQDLAVFYGRNRTDYYLTEGLPLLLTTALPFAIHGMWHALRGQPSPIPHEEQSKSRTDDTALSVFAWTTVAVTTAMSMIAHKEVRFLYPLLPLLHVLCGHPLSRFFHPHASPSRRALLAILLGLNLAVAFYTTQVHQRGVIDVTTLLRGVALGQASREVDVAFLMPCHSTPWRSHLVVGNLDAWALSCEPPLDVPLSERAGYLDEADRFYADPRAWMEGNMVLRGGDVDSVEGPRREWPEYLVFFEALERDLRSYMTGVQLGYAEYWRGFNSHWHDDWRRKGDVVVWKLA